MIFYAIVSTFSDKDIFVANIERKSRYIYEYVC